MSQKASLTKFRSEPEVRNDRSIDCRTYQPGFQQRVPASATVGSRIRVLGLSLGFIRVWGWQGRVSQELPR